MPLTKLNIDITLNTNGTYVIGGAFNSNFNKFDFNDNSAISGNYWFLCAKNPGSIENLTSVSYNITTQGIQSMNKVISYYSSEARYLGDLNDTNGLMLQSYYLSQIHEIKPILIDNLSYDRNFYTDHTTVPKFIQKDEFEYGDDYTDLNY
jgi:hypothetical protein